MPSKPFEPILHRDLSIVSAKPSIDIAHQLFQELVNYATNAIVRCAASSDSDPNVDVAVLTLYRHIFEMTDAIDVLVTQACVVPAIPLIRSSFESSISMDYMLSDNTKYARRSLAWIVQFFNDRLSVYAKLDPTTTEGQDFQKSIAAEEGMQDLNLPTNEKLGTEIERVNQVLSTPQFSQIYEEYQSIRNTRKSWYWLDGGPQSLRQLAYAVGRNATYDFMYGYWSRFSHAQDLSRSLVKGSTEGRGGMAPIRDTDELRNVVLHATHLMLKATEKLIKKFRPDEEEQYLRWYSQDVRKFYIHFFPKAK